MRRDRLDQTLEHLVIAPTPNRSRRLGTVHHPRVTMVHDGRAHRSLPTPPTRPGHPLEYALIVCLELAEPGPVLDLELEQIDARPCIFFGVVSALAARLNLTVTPLFGEPCEPGFERSTARVVVHECGVDAERVTDPEGFEIGFERVTNEDGGGAAWGCEKGEEVGLHLGERRRRHGEGCFGDA